MAAPARRRTPPRLCLIVLLIIRIYLHVNFYIHIYIYIYIFFLPSSLPLLPPSPGRLRGVFGGPEAKYSPIQNHGSVRHLRALVGISTPRGSLLISFLNRRIRSRDRQISPTLPDLFQHQFAYSFPNFGGHVARLIPNLNYRSCGTPSSDRLSDSGRARSKPFPHALVFRITLVGTSQLPQTTTINY